MILLVVLHKLYSSVSHNDDFWAYFTPFSSVSIVDFEQVVYTLKYEIANHV